MSLFWMTLGRAGLGVGLAAVLAAGLAACATLPGWMIVQGQSTITDHRHFDNAPIARSMHVAALPVVPAALHWPGGKTDAEVERTLSDNGSVAFIVIQRGVVVYERYFNGYARDSMLTSFSIAKSVISSLLGIGIAEGRIASVDDPVTRYLTELRRNDPRFDAITLRHLLAMRGGIAFDESYRSPFSEAARFYLTDDLGAEVAKLRVEGEPDRAYRYQSVNTQLLAMAIERATGHADRSLPGEPHLAADGRRVRRQLEPGQRRARNGARVLLPECPCRRLRALRAGVSERWPLQRPPGRACRVGRPEHRSAGAGRYRRHRLAQHRTPGLTEPGVLRLAVAPPGRRRSGRRQSRRPRARP